MPHWIIFSRWAWNSAALRALYMAFSASGRADHFLPSSFNSAAKSSLEEPEARDELSFINKAKARRAFGINPSFTALARLFCALELALPCSLGFFLVVWPLDSRTLDPEPQAPRKFTVAFARRRRDGARKHTMAPRGALMGQTVGSSNSQHTNKPMPRQSQQHMLVLFQAKHPSMLAKHPSNANFGHFLRFVHLKGLLW